MKVLEDYSQRLVLTLERRKGQLPYSFVWYLFALGIALFLFGFLDRVWAYYLEGMIVIGGAVVLFVVETCWRRIVELKTFLAEYRKTDRAETIESMLPDCSAASE